MQKKLRTFFLMIATLLLLSGCGKEEVVEEVVTEPQYPAGAILPVLADEEKGIKSTEIALTDFTFTIPEGYVYGKVDYENYSGYYIWQDKADKEYAFATDGDVMLYIYDGLDSNSPHEEISDAEARISLANYIGYHTNSLDGRNINMDAEVTNSYDDKNYLYCFTGNGGDAITTTYNVMCYPKTYYGIYALQKYTKTYDRHFYGFVFSNDDEGEIFKESEYNFLLDEIKTALKADRFFTLQQGEWNYDPMLDIADGRNYEQMLDLFANTYLYYVETIGKPWERENVDPETENIDEDALDFENASFSIHFIDVGQADATLVQCDGEYMMVDGGYPIDSDKIYTILKNNKVNHLKMIVATHAHEDHIGGLSGALLCADSDLTLCPVTEFESDEFKDFKKYAEENGGGITVPSVGDTYSLGSATVKVLAVNNGTLVNDTCIVLKITYGQTSFILTGDAGREVEKSIIDSGADLSADVLKVGHHGSETSTSYHFLREVMPEHAVISVGKDNIHGHPTETVLSLLKDADVNIWRTDLLGDIYCTSDGKKVYVSNEIQENDLINDTTGEDAHAGLEAIKSLETLNADISGNVEADDSSSSITYVLNTNSKRFHYNTCNNAEDISNENREETTLSRDEIIANGYSPCGNCEP